MSQLLQFKIWWCTNGNIKVSYAHIRLLYKILVITSLESNEQQLFYNYLLNILGYKNAIKYSSKINLQNVLIPYETVNQILMNILVQIKVESLTELGYECVLIYIFLINLQTNAISFYKDSISINNSIIGIDYLFNNLLSENQTIQEKTHNFLLFLMSSYDDEQTFLVSIK